MYLVMPVNSRSFSISVTTTASASTALPGDNPFIRFFNAGTVPVFVSVGTGVQTATVPTGTPASTCTVIAPGAIEPFSMGVGVTNNISAITASGTATLYVQVGGGA